LSTRLSELETNVKTSASNGEPDFSASIGEPDLETNVKTSASNGEPDFSASNGEPYFSGGGFGATPEELQDPILGRSNAVKIHDDKQKKHQRRCSMCRSVDHLAKECPDRSKWKSRPCPAYFSEKGCRYTKDTCYCYHPEEDEPEPWPDEQARRNAHGIGEWVKQHFHPVPSQA